MPINRTELEQTRQEMMAEHEMAGEQVEMWADVETEESHAMVEHFAEQQSHLKKEIKRIEAQLS